MSLSLSLVLVLATEDRTTGTYLRMCVQLKSFDLSLYLKRSSAIKSWTALWSGASEDNNNINHFSSSSSRLIRLSYDYNTCSNNRHPSMTIHRGFDGHTLNPYSASHPPHCPFGIIMPRMSRTRPCHQGEESENQWKDFLFISVLHLRANELHQEKIIITKYASATA